MSAANVLDPLHGRTFIVVNRRMEIAPRRVATPTRILGDLGYPVRQVDDGPLDAAPEDVVLFWGSPVWFPKAVGSVRERPAPQRPLTVVWFVEPLPPPRDSGLRWPRPNAREIAKIALRDRRASDVYSNYWSFRRLARHGLPDVLAVISGERKAFLAEHGIDSVVVPYGYEQGDGRDLGLERDVDVLFLGLVASRSRKRALERIRHAGIPLHVLGSYDDPALWGESRTRLVNRTKILLSISRFPAAFAPKRFLLGMGCNALVVSDPIYDPSPFARGEHFVEAPLDELPAVITHYLARDEERSRIAQAGHDFATRDVTMEASVKQLLGVVGERLAAR